MKKNLLFSVAGVALFAFSNANAQLPTDKNKLTETTLNNDSSYSLNLLSSGETSNFIITRYWDNAGSITAQPLSVAFDKTLGDGTSTATSFNWVEDANGNKKLEVTTAANPDLIAQGLGSRLSYVARNTDLVNSFVNIKSTSSSGGALSLTSSASINLTGDFVGNSMINASEAQAGALQITGGTLITIKSSFIGNVSHTTGNSFSTGGAMTTSGSKITQVTGDFISNNTISNNNTAFGGAIHNYTSTITGINGDFISNSAIGKTGANGGAISNSTGSTISSITGNFINNYTQSQAGNAAGGAIFNRVDISSIIGSFENNGKNLAGDVMTDWGGAIYVIANSTSASAAYETNIYGSTFTANAANNDGGAIYITNLVSGTRAAKTNIEISSKDGKSTSFYANEANNGGAIYNNSTLGDISIEANFIENNATTAGGAIYNIENATINILANNANIMFKGNTAAGISNAIYNDGTINLSSANTYQIQTYDTFSGSGTYKLTSGTLALLGANAHFLGSTNFEVNTGATISTIDNHIRETNLGTLELTGNINYGLDIDVSTLSGDTLSGTLSTENAGKIVISQINIIGSQTASQIQVNLSSDLSGIIDLSNDEVINSDYDAILYDPLTGLLTLKKAYTLNDAVIDTTSERSYNMAGIEAVTQTLGTLKGSTLTINGNKNSIAASNSADGIIINSGQTLNINNVNMISGFTNSFVDANAGTININADTGNSTTFASAIAGSANIFINSDDTKEGNIYFQTQTDANSINIANGTTTFNGAVNANSITNNATTIFNSNVTSSITNDSNITANNSSIVGSIANQGTITLNNSAITGNITQTGAITTTGTSSFTNSEIANTISVNSGTTSFNNAQINGAITTTDTGSVVFSGTTTLNEALTTNNTISNSGTLNLNNNLILNSAFNGGSINLGNDTTLTINSGASLENLVGFSATSSSTLNIANNQIGSHALGTSSFVDGSSLDVDMRLDISNGDIISDTIAGNASGEVTVNIVNMLNTGSFQNISGITGTINIFEAGSVTVNPFANSETYSILSQNYTINLNTATNGLTYEVLVGENSLASAITSITTPRSYEMSTEESAGTGDLTGDLTINARNNNITDGSITMLESSVLTINDATMNADVSVGKNALITLNNTDYKSNIYFTDDNTTLSINNSNISTDISSAYANTVVNFNSGTINFDGSMSGVTANLQVDLNRTAQDTNVTYNLNNGTLSYNNDAFLSGGTNTINFNGGALDLINNTASTINLDNVTLNDTANLYLDVDLAAKKMDTISANIFDSKNNILDIKGLNIISHGVENKTEVTFTTNADIINATQYNGDSSIETTALSPIYIYDVLYNQGLFTFTRKEGDEGYTPSVQTESVSTQTIYNATIDFTKQMLSALDAYSPIQGRSSGDDYDIGGAWIKVYASDEDVDLGSINVDSKTYAGVFGVDSKAQYYSNGIKGIYSLYVAYLQSEQKYDDVTIDQDGINFGAKAMFDKNNWFAGAVANMGINFIDGYNTAGHENFETYTAALSLKTGYDINMYCEQYILQPNITMSYLYGYTPNYTNASNVEIRSDALHAFNINPELKFIAHLDNQFSPYASIGYNWNVEAGGDIKADNIALPELSVDPYAEYKLGFTKQGKDNMSGYAEAFATTGGRQGYGIQAGLKWQF